MKRLALFAAVPVVLSVAAACSSSTRSNVFEDDAGTGPGSPTPGDGGSLFRDGGGGPRGGPWGPNPANAQAVDGGFEGAAAAACGVASSSAAADADG